MMCPSTGEAATASQTTDRRRRRSARQKRSATMTRIEAMTAFSALDTPALYAEMQRRGIASPDFDAACKWAENVCDRIAKTSAATLATMTDWRQVLDHASGKDKPQRSADDLPADIVGTWYDVEFNAPADRVQIVQDCLANGCDYGATALKYNVDYKALVNWVGRYRAHGPAALHDSRHSSEGTRRAKGRARAVAPMQRLVIVLDCLENRKNYGAMAQKYAVAYHQVYRWVQRYLQDGWLGMNDRRGPADDPGPEGEWARVAPANEDAAEKWVARCAGVPDVLPALLRRAGYSWCVIAKILFDLARM